MAKRHSEPQCNSEHGSAPSHCGSSAIKRRSYCYTAPCLLHAGLGAILPILHQYFFLLTCIRAWAISSINPNCALWRQRYELHDECFPFSSAGVVAARLDDECDKGNPGKNIPRAGLRKCGTGHCWPRVTVRSKSLVYNSFICH